MSDDISANHALAAFLGGLAGLYGIVVRLRIKMFRHRLLRSHRLPCKVVSVGNITLGGTGKTPMSIYLARLLDRAGYRVAVVSRGYKGSAEKGGGVVSDGQALRMTPAAAGDEPYLMARQLLPCGIPVLVGGERARSGGLAVRKYGAEVIVLDDGFQHLRLQRDLDIVLLDAEKPFGNGHILPRGTLREPLSSLSRADACVLTRCPRSAAARATWQPLPEDDQRGAGRRRHPLFPASHTPFIAECLATGISGLGSFESRINDRGGGPVYAFSGLARNDTFQVTLREMGFDVRGSKAFSDHHTYTRQDFSSMEARAHRVGAQSMVTTEKDRVKIDDAWIGNMPLLVIGVRMDLGNHTQAFEQFVTDSLDLPARRIV